MANALDTFRAQRDAADRIHAQLLETAALLRALQTPVSAITRDGEPRAGTNGVQPSETDSWHFPHGRIGDAWLQAP